MDQRSPDTRPLGVQTTAVHAGEAPDCGTHASAPNLVMSTTFVIDPDVAFSANEITENTPFAYTRWANPTVAQLERKLAELEGAEACLAFASGMAAIWTLFSGLLKSGDHLVMGDVTYAAASELANDTLPALGIEVTRVDTSDLAALREALRPNTRLLYLESPANPLLRLTDIPAAVQIGHDAGIPVAVDSTFATPIGMRPIEHGADYVTHSLTKYICGHGDALGGALLGRTEDLDRLRSTAIHMGGVLSPFNAWLIIRGAATLPIRMRAHQEASSGGGGAIGASSQGHAGHVSGTAFPPAARPRPPADGQLLGDADLPGGGRPGRSPPLLPAPAGHPLRGVARSPP